jgi:hypothetical protein
MVKPVAAKPDEGREPARTRPIVRSGLIFFSRCWSEMSHSPPQRHVHQRDHYRHLDERPDDGGERLPGADAEHADSDGDSQLMHGVNKYLQWKTTFRIVPGLDQTCILATLMAWTTHMYFISNCFKIFIFASQPMFSID